MDIRFGIGYDVHQLAAGRKLILGGVEIPHAMGLVGHSDADVLLHAIKDALLGAAAMGDIGKLFPDNDMRYKGVSSLWLLEQVETRLVEKGWRVNNIDATIAAEQPKLAAFIPLMRDNIARTLRVSADRVNVKATTSERLGFVGRQEGISAYAIASLLGGSQD
ncbi:MAG: 2-C-methyl-D-erythritol 2,4-cyclodiphosphate synthase [Sporomusaceae bacterium]|nr:2-C-methyl-D-erythritol 2,4-cyclodiphosphate synthase [Sporomusaceae bacterium]